MTNKDFIHKMLEATEYAQHNYDKDNPFDCIEGVGFMKALSMIAPEEIKEDYDRISADYLRLAIIGMKKGGC